MNLGNLLKEAEKLEKSFEKAQQKLENIPVETSAAGGAIKISSNATGEFLAIKIDPKIFEAKDVQALEEVLLAALKQSKEDVQKAAQKEFDQIAKAFDIPELPEA
jgi:DNA-binding YbaB/EbfC family protein